MYGTVPTGKPLHYTAKLLELHNHNLMTYLHQVAQTVSAGWHLRKRFETVYIEVKRGTYLPTTSGVILPQQTPLSGPKFT